MGEDYYAAPSVNSNFFSELISINLLIQYKLFVRRYHPHFKNVMQSRISQLMGIDYKFDLLLSEDGSGRGAALVAAVLKRTEKEDIEAGITNGNGSS